MERVEGFYPLDPLVFDGTHRLALSLSALWPIHTTAGSYLRHGLSSMVCILQ